jgi:dsRNA-specific ribonuclease
MKKEKESLDTFLTVNVAKYLVEKFMERKPDDVSDLIADYLVLGFLNGVGETGNLLLQMLKDCTDSKKDASSKALQELLAQLCLDTAEEVEQRALAMAPVANKQGD